MIIFEIYRSGINASLEAFINILPLFMPFLTAFFALVAWKYYVVREFISKIEWVVLEIKLPKEQHKTPKSMEIVMNVFQQFPPTNLYEEWWTGKIVSWFSLELVSIEGKVHFFIRTDKTHKKLVENTIYSQFSDVEIHQVEDYTTKVPYGQPGSNWQFYGTEYTLLKDDAYPIKTYVDYGLDKEGIKEEFKTDPITSTLEFLGSIGKGEQIWIQIMLMTTQNRYVKATHWYAEKEWGKMFGRLWKKIQGKDYDDWKDNAKALIEKLMKRDKKDESGVLRLEILSPGERTIVEAVERSFSKIGFDVGIRGLYLGEGDKYSKSNIGSLLGFFRPYGTANLNGIKPVRLTQYNWWKDLTGRNIIELKNYMFKAYRDRGYFYMPYRHKPIVLNTEELATIFHFPGAVAETPTIPKIESKRSEAPSNLPI